MELSNKIGIIKEQYMDILQALTSDFEITLNYEHIENIFGGNPTEKVTFSANINGIPYKAKEFCYMGYNKTKDAFINEIKSYLMDTLDSVINL